MELLDLEYQDNVAIVSFTRSVTSPLNPAIVKKLTETLTKLRDEPTVHGLVLTSSNTKFVFV